ncbi:MAG: DUF4388 domain-containing protein [Lentisphaerota bacterium]
MNPTRPFTTGTNNPLIQPLSNVKQTAFYDIVFCTGDQALWNDYSLFFKYEQPDCRVGYINGPDKLKPVLQRLMPEGLLLYDLRNGAPEVASGHLKAWDHIKEKVVVIGLSDSEDLPAHCEVGPWIRLDAVISVAHPAVDNWARMQNIRNALKTPLMSLRIEDVSVSDILQLLGMSERSSNVVIRGRVHDTSPWMEGRLFFQKGLLEFAVTSHHAGDKAVFDLLALRQGTIEVLPCFWLPGRSNIRVSLDKLLLDFAVGYDEAAAQEAADETHTGEELVPSDESTAAGAIDIAAALAAGTWGSHSQRDIPDRFQGVFPIHMFRSRWADLPQECLERLDGAGEGALPLDWISPMELSICLDQHPGLRVVSLRGSLEFLICMMSSWHDQFNIDRFVEGFRPVIRLGDHDDDAVWFVGDLDEQPLEVLSDYPCAVWTEPRESDLTLRRNAAKGHPAVVLMTSDIKLYSISLNWGLAYEGRVTAPHDGILAKADSWPHVRGAMSNLLKVLKGLAARCK